MAKAPERDYLIKLRQILVTYFDRDGLRTLCFDLDIEPENLPDALGGMARELVRLCERQSRIPELIAIGKQQRPDIPWDDALTDRERRALCELSIYTRKCTTCFETAQ